VKIPPQRVKEDFVQHQEGKKVNDMQAHNLECVLPLPYAKYIHQLELARLSEVSSLSIHYEWMLLYAVDQAIVTKKLHTAPSSGFIYFHRAFKLDTS
jgi:hypothetical protein